LYKEIMLACNAIVFISGLLNGLKFPLKRVSNSKPSL
jgi:hypothetical protein